MDAERCVTLDQKTDCRKKNMQDIQLSLTGMDVNFETYREITGLLAAQGDEETMLVAWSDRGRGNHSPCCVKCQIGAEPGWEVYGRNHGGRLRFSINNDEYVFIYT